MSRFMLFGALLVAFKPFSTVKSAQYAVDSATADADTVLGELPSVQVSDARLRGKAAADLTRALLGLSLVTALMAVVFLVLHCYKTLRLNSNLGTVVRRLAEDDEPQCSEEPEEGEGAEEAEEGEGFENLPELSAALEEAAKLPEEEGAQHIQEFVEGSEGAEEAEEGEGGEGFENLPELSAALEEAAKLPEEEGAQHIQEFVEGSEGAEEAEEGEGGEGAEDE